MGWYCKRRVIWKASGGLYANNREQFVYDGWYERQAVAFMPTIGNNM
jgi:hypothetical protein